MKALTLTEPWATLVAIGAKKIETRSWSTTYRGPIAIHAAKGMPGWAIDTLREPGPIRDAIWGEYGGWIWGNKSNRHVMEQTRGKVLAIARLTYCLRIPDYARQGRAITKQERFFGDFTPGRFAWVLEDVQRLPEPIPARGALGLWELDDALLSGLAVAR